MSEAKNNQLDNAAVKKDKPVNKKPGFVSRVKKWVKELRSESKKIVWPTRKQVINNTLVVLATVMIIGIFIWIFDLLLNLGISSLLNIF